MTEKQDVYTRVTRKIIADLERGSLTWLQPWQAGHQAGPVSRPLRASGTPYRGVNVLMLWASAMESGYSNPLWLTYRQANELGGQVRKGEKGTLVVYADTFTRTETGENGEANAVEIPFMKGYTVFNAEQVDGLPGHFYATPLPVSSGYGPAGRRGALLCGDRREGAPRRRHGLLQPLPRPGADAGVSGLPRHGELLRHPRP